MNRLESERILVIADADRQVQATLVQLLPSAEVTASPSWFDAIHHLARERFTTILASAEPIERRPESAVRAVRGLAGDARLVLFGHPTLEPLSRKMLEFGSDDYLVAPASPLELGQVLRAARMRIAPELGGGSIDEAPARPESEPIVGNVALAEILLDALLEAPHSPLGQAVAALTGQLAPDAEVAFTAKDERAPAAPQGRTVLSHAVRSEEGETGQLHLMLGSHEDANAARHLLARLAGLAGKVQTLHERHASLQKLAITDELTGLYNARYFRHFLARIVDLARHKRFPVTLFIFDIDNFKQYNDDYGHAAGDDILRQTATLMKRCCREHDLVARIGGDEFAVVFWEKDGPRVPRQPGPAPGKPPQTPVEVLNRFRKLLAVQDLPSLGTTGKGVLTISGGIAVFPYDAWDVEQLFAAADNQLMQRAKKAGKNSIYLVGSEERLPTEQKLPDEEKT
ncbi:MAG: GGDEF domain-containing protein [Tepidisphaeraceae bacterium]|jgi:PleD family two-component response regulator